MSLLSETWTLVSELVLDGFLATLALSVIAPLIGCQLILARRPLFALALPQAAALGAPLAWWWVTPAAGLAATHAHPSATALLVATSITVGACALLLVLVSARSGGGSESAVLYLVAIAALPLVSSGLPHEAQLGGSSGQVFAVLPDGRNQVFLVAGLVFALLSVLEGRLRRATVAPDSERLTGGRPSLILALGLVIAAALFVGTVPIVGPEVVLALVLIPPVVLAPAAPGLRAWRLLSVASSLLGVLAAFLLAVARDWPLAPSLVLALTVASLLIAALTAASTRLRPSH